MTRLPRRARSRGLRELQRLFALSSESLRSGLPPEELEHRAAAAWTRREIVAAGAGIAAGAAALTPAGALARSLARRGQPRIAIVGAGLAGLSCARLLAARGFPSTVYEGNPARAGGRCWTLRGFFAGGISVEHGGEFIDSDQFAVRHLARALGLAEEEVNGGTLPEGEEIYFDSEGLYTRADLTADWHSFGYAAFQKAVAEVGTPHGARRLDALNVDEWLEASGIGTTSRFGKLLLADTVTENGGPPEDQSALNVIELMSRDRRLPSTLTGHNERFHVVGGNDQLVSGVIAELPPGTVELGHRLIAVSRAGHGVRLIFEAGGSPLEVGCDFAVLALPFSTLREAELAAAGLSAAKLRVIDTLGMGTNAKVHIEVARKTWPPLGYSGPLYGEWQGLACGWDDCVELGADAEPAVYVAFPGAERGATGLTGAAHGPAPSGDVAWALSEIDRVFPGTSAAHAGLLAYEDHWALDPWVHGAYSYDRVGQGVDYWRIGGRREGPLLFAGEHTADRNQGYLEGAVETGERAALELVRALR